MTMSVKERNKPSPPIISGIYAYPIKWGITIFMDLISWIKDLLCNAVCLLHSRASEIKII